MNDSNAEDTPVERRIAPGRLIPPAVIVLGFLAWGATQLWAARQPYQWSGTVEARTMSVGSRVGGRVKNVLVKEGDRVEAAQTLIELEAGDLYAQKLIAEGQLAQAQANHDKLVKGARPEEIEAARARAQGALAALKESNAGARSEDVAQAEGRLETAESLVSRAKLDLGRVDQLLAKGAASRAEKENAEIQLRSATSQRDTVKHALDELKHGLRVEQINQAEARAKEAQAGAQLIQSGARVEDIQAAKGQVDAAEGRVQQIMTMIDELVIRAPRVSRVETLDLRPGDILLPNGRAAELIEDDQLYLRIFVPETQLGHVQVGQELPISVDSFQDRTFKGRVEHINSVGEYSPRNLQTADERADQVFATRIGIVEGYEQLRAGMAASVKVKKP